MCQLLTTITIPTGDRGGPVFFWHGQTITLAGIIVGSVNQNGVFSRFDHISRELGANGFLGRVQ